MPGTSPRPGNSTQRDGLQTAWLACILLASVALRGWHLEHQSLTHDEVFEVQAIQQPFEDFFWSSDGFPPLHRVVLWSLAKMTSSEFAGRWFALACGVAIIVALYGCGNFIGGPYAGLGVASWAAISPLQIYYSQEARAYGLYLAAAAFALWAFLFALRHDSRRGWWGLVVACAIGQFTHYYFTLWILLFGLLWLWDRWNSRRWLNGSVAFLALVLLELARLPLLQRDLAESMGYPEQTPFNLSTFGYTLYSFLGGYCLGPSQTTLHELTAREALPRFVPYILPLCGLAVIPTWTGGRMLRDRGWLYCLLILGVVPLLLAGMLAHGLNLNYNVRYVAIASLPFLIMWGCGWSAISNRAVRTGILLAMTGFTLWGLYQRNYRAEYQNEDVRSAARYIADHDSPDDATVFINVGYMARPIAYYLGKEWHVVELPEAGNPNGVFQSATEARVFFSGAEASSGRTIWVVLTRSFHGDPQGYLIRFLRRDSRFRRVTVLPGVVIFQRSRSAD